MGRGRPHRRAERASSTTEFIGACVALVALTAALAQGMAPGGTAVATRLATRLERAVVSPVGREPAGREPAATEPGNGATVRLAEQRVQAAALNGRRRVWHERRRSGGSAPVHVPRGELRLAPLVDERAMHSTTWQERRSGELADANASARACALCMALEWRHEARPGATVDKAGRRVGLDARARAEGRLALLAAESTASAHLRAGPADGSAHGRVRATLGIEGDAEARLQVGRNEQDVELRAGAMAGAAVRAEARLGVDLLGVAIRQTARAEGWAGAGARGVIGVRRTDTRLDWRFGWGAALGLGGATEWSGSIDISDVPDRHRRLARDALAVAARASRYAAPLPPRPLYH